MTSTTVHFREPNDRAAKGGYTLAEVIIATSLTALIVGGLTSSFMFLMKSSVGIGNYVDMNVQSRMGLERFGREARMATSVRDMSAISFHIWVDTPSGIMDVTYAYDAQNKTLTRTLVGGPALPILHDVTNLTFRYYNLLDVQTANITEAKKVQLDAEMMRNVLYIENTNHVMSARYTMRNRSVSN